MTDSLAVPAVSLPFPESRVTSSPFTPAQFDALCASSGLVLSPERRERLWAARGLVEAMRATLWPDLPPDAEPAHVFVPATATIEKKSRA